MSSFESAFDSLLQGVSQQIPRMRLPGQVSEMINGLADPVTNWRRRPGAEYLFSTTYLPYATTNSIRAWEVDLGAQRVHVLLDVNHGDVVLLNETFTLLAVLQSNYLISPDVKRIKAVVVGSEMFFVNTGVTPTTVPRSGVLTPTKRGFLYVLAGAFSKQFDMVINTNTGTITGTYTTPDASVAGAAANATPEAIANGIVASLIANGIVAFGMGVVREGPYIYVEATSPAITSVVVSSNAGSVYTTPSNASRVRLESNLPAKLPANADGYIMAVGAQKLLTYYQYNAATFAWLESGDFASPSGLANMPVVLKFTGVWSISNANFEGRVAGDDEQNPLPPFLETGITGIGSYQGRLVLLAGSQAALSSSKNPLRFMRSTVTGILDEDPITIGSGSNTSANYEYAVAFQKDLILFSSRYQALIPGGNSAITPRNATVLVTSTFSGDMQSEPLPIGRTLLYPTPLSSDYFGILEMISSQYSDSQYVSNHATEHLPKYMRGKCRFSASSSVASTALFGQSNDLSRLIVYQYLWSSEEKIQQAWHKWEFYKDVAYSYFSGETVNVLFVANGIVVGARIDPKDGILSDAPTRKPYLDLYGEVAVLNRQATLPGWIRTYDPLIGDNLKLCRASGPLAGEEIGIESYDPMTGVVTTVRSFTENEIVYFGVPYRSLLSPTVPEVKDAQGNKIDTNKLTILRYGITTQNSSEYQIALKDYGNPFDTYPKGTLRWCSTELDLGQARYNTISRAIVPARTDADTTVLEIFTEGLGEMNIIGIDYTCRYNQKIRRR